MQYTLFFARFRPDIVSILNLQASYFAVENPLRLLDRWTNRFSNRQTALFGGREITFLWTDRAQRALSQRESSLVVELQLYFSCVVKKRVVFHRQASFATLALNDNIEFTFRALASAACGPEEFASDFPQGKDLSRGPAARMIPKKVEIDFRKGCWEGHFFF